ncbi:methylated-DNA--[protein]-cysteine S-methyltransferase [Brevibacterium metallidurans]|uniref:Methylated-DNA--protein-cysteine methyltransferase n=1 Tax=Brevibacterium metallidurans TaxID=1482676 RepID=A0ABN0SJE0_9MICO
MTGSDEAPTVQRGQLDTAVGLVALTSTGEAIVRLEWVTAEEAGSDGGVPRDPLLVDALAQVRAYFDGRLGEFDLPLSLAGISAVATTVLRTLADTVGFGETVTYGQLAERSGTGIPARAIGSIMGMNPLPLIIPCHRVVAGDGLGGYSGGPPGQGLETKRRLLEFEGALPQSLF